MTNLITKTFASFAIRIVTIDGNPWFVAIDVARALGLGLHKGSVSHHMRRLDQDEKRQTSTSDMGVSVRNSLTVVSESGLYKLILRSDKEQARRFQNWVTRDVLPAIRKDGGYILGEEKVATGELSEDELVFRAMEVMKRKIERLSVENASMKEVLEERLTADTYRAIHMRCYLPRGGTSQLGRKASEFCRARGIVVTTEQRIIQTPYGDRETFVNLYPKSALDWAWKTLGFDRFR